MVELAKQLGNVSQVCKMMGYCRDSFYRLKELYECFRKTVLNEFYRFARRYIVPSMSCKPI